MSAAPPVEPHPLFPAPTAEAVPSADAKAIVEAVNGAPGCVGENTSDGYHTFKELYRYRMLYNAAFFNALAAFTDIPVVKSHRHSDGEPCFGGGWFIVMAQLPTGQVSNHYEDQCWDLFGIPAVDCAPKWDGHTPNDAADRIEAYLAARREQVQVAFSDGRDADEVVAEQRARLARLDAEYHLFANQAKMRTALAAHLAYWNGVVRTKAEERLRRQAEAALDAPPRNCELYASVDEARDAFFKVYFGPTDMGFWEMAFVDWLFAARKEDKP